MPEIQLTVAFRVTRKARELIEKLLVEEAQTYFVRARNTADAIERQAYTDLWTEMLSVSRQIHETEETS